MSKAIAVLVTTATLLLNSFTVLAEMTLDQSLSTVSFMSIKNEHIAEQHSFDRFTGAITKQNKLLITIDISSVNTLIPIRNERMKSLFFNAEKYTNATFTAQLNNDMTSLKPGEMMQTIITGQMTIAGTTAPVSFDVTAVALEDGHIQASTNKPTLLSTSTFNLDDGLAALKKIAMLQSISKAVPLSFNTTFSRSN